MHRGYSVHPLYTRERSHPGVNVRYAKRIGGRTMLAIKFRRPIASLKRSRPLRRRPEHFMVSKQEYKANPQILYIKAKKSDRANNDVVPITISKRTR